MFGKVLLSPDEVVGGGGPETPTPGATPEIAKKSPEQEGGGTGGTEPPAPGSTTETPKSESNSYSAPPGPSRNGKAEPVQPRHPRTVVQLKRQRRKWTAEAVAPAAPAKANPFLGIVGNPQTGMSGLSAKQQGVVNQ